MTQEDEETKLAEQLIEQAEALHAKIGDVRLEIGKNGIHRIVKEEYKPQSAWKTVKDVFGL